MVLQALTALANGVLEAPFYHLVLEALLLIWVIWLVKRKKKSEEKRVILTPEEEDEIIRAWTPRPLVDVEELDRTDSFVSEAWHSLESRPGKFLVVDGKKYLNLATHNYLGLVDEKSIDEEAERCIKKYGVGSCGPRGFYGTVDVHLELEEKISKFMKVEESALYSYGFSTIASAIPSYAKTGDIIFADEHVHFAIQKGLQASRSIIIWFKHNDPDDLDQHLKAQAARDIKNPKKAKTQRRFCIVEGIYMKTGEMCPLREINKLCRHHKVRLFLDETVSFASLGATGRGITEHFDVPVEDIDFISGTMENSLASFGGFITGSSFVVDHQRISGVGYCFSASLPPLLAGAGIQALKLVDENPEMIAELQNNCRLMHSVLSSLQGFNVGGHELSPLKFLTLKKSCGGRREVQLFLDKVIIFVKDNHNIALVQPSCLEDQEATLVSPNIRIAVNRLLTQNEIASVGLALDKAAEALDLD